MNRKTVLLISILLLLSLLFSAGASAAGGFASAAAVGGVSEGMVSFRTADGLWGFADLQGSTVFEPRWNYVYSFSDGAARVFSGTTKSNGTPQDGLYGYLLRDGSVIRPRWSDAGNFSEGFAAVCEDGKWGFIDQTGTVVIPCQWDYAGPFSDGRALVFNGTLKSMNLPGKGNYGFIDAQGNLISDGWEYAGNYADGCARVQLNGKYGYIDPDGQYISEPQWDHASDFLSGFGMVFMGTLSQYGTPGEGLYGYVGADGQVIAPRWEEAVPFHEGLAPVRENGLWGYIDGTGAAVIPCEWDYAWFFSGGVGVTYTGPLGESGRPTEGTYHMIDREGRVTGQLEGDRTPTFLNGYATVEQDGRWGAMNGSGSIVLNCQWDSRLYFDESGHTVASMNGRWYILDGNGVNQYGEDTNTDAFLRSTLPADVRSSRWGDSPEQVRAAEGEPLHEFDPEGDASWVIGYEETYAGVYGMLLFSFIDDHLYSVMFHSLESHIDASDYNRDYEALCRAVNAERGEPAAERDIWDSEQHRLSYSDNPGFALRCGWLTRNTIHEDDRTISIVTLRSGEDIVLFVQYLSLEYSPE